MSKYHVLMSESLAKTIEIEAKSAEEAERLVDEGMWYDDWVVKEKGVDRTVVDSEEVKDKGKREIWYDTRLRLKRDLQGEDDGWSECGWHTLPEGTEVTFEGKYSCRSGGLYATVTSAQSERGKKFRFDPRVINVSMPGGTGEIVNLDDFEILDRGREEK